MLEVILKVKTISCQGCVNALKSAFSNIDGIQFVEPSYKTGDIKIIFDETKISLEKIKEIIKKTGREVI